MWWRAQEAAILDSQNAEVWGMTCNVCLLQAQVVKPGEIYQPKADEVSGSRCHATDEVARS